jgi:iron complex outermembrane receptor protein
VLDGVTVVERREEGALVGPRTSLNQAMLDAGAGLPLAERIKVLPGVDALQTGTTISKPMIQGLTGNRVLILNNGIRLEGQQWGQEHAPEIDPFIAEEVSVYRGTQGLQFGPGALGGVVLVNPAAPDFVKRISAKALLSAASNGWGGSASAMVAGLPLKRLPLFVRGHFTATGFGDRRAPDYLLSNTGNREMHYSLTAAWQRPGYGVEFFYSAYRANIGILRAAHFGNLTDLTNAIEQGKPPVQGPFTYAIQRPNQEVFHDMFKVSGSVLVHPRHELEWQVSRQFNDRQEFDLHRTLGADPNQPQLDYRLTTWMADVHWHIRHTNGRTKVGLQGVTMANTYRGRFLIPNYELQGIGGFVMHDRAMGKALFEAILRWDGRQTTAYFNQAGDILSDTRLLNGWGGSAGFRLPTKGYGEWNLTLGSTWRPPFVNEWYSDGLHHGSGSIERGNPDLVPERSLDVQATWKYAFQRAGTLEALAGYRWINQFIYLLPGRPQLTLAGAFPVFDYAQTNAWQASLDLLHTMEWSPALTWSNSGSLLYVAQQGGGFLPLMPPAKLRTGWTYRWEGGPAIQTGLAYTFEQYWAPTEGDLLPPPTGFLLVDAKLEQSWGKGTWQHSVTVGATNLLNTRYRNYLDRWRYFADQPGINVYVQFKTQF